MDSNKKLGRKPSPRTRITAPPLLSPSEIKAIRLYLGWGSRQAGRLTGAGENSFPDLESGRAMPSKVLNTLLCALALRPSLADALARGEQPDLPKVRQALADATPTSMYSALSVRLMP